MPTVARESTAAGRAGEAVSLRPLRPLAGASLLDAWERGADQGDLERAITLLAAASGAPAAELARLDLPARNRALLRLRWVSFGADLAGFVPCERCGARLEFAVSVPQVLARLEDLVRGGTTEWTSGSVRCALRPATTEDLLAAVAEPDDDAARRRLLERCATAPGTDEAGLAAVRSDPEVLARLERLHEAAEITCAVRCPGCGASDLVDLDIARFLWDEVRHGALRLLRDVHDLASAYGWSEDAVLAMSPQRRRAYLEMVYA